MLAIVKKFKFLTINFKKNLKKNNIKKNLISKKKVPIADSGDSDSDEEFTEKSIEKQDEISKKKMEKNL